jgi:hypothetical protein
MDNDRTSFERNLLVATSILGSVGGLFAAINGLSETAQKFLGVFAGFGKWQLLAAALVLVAVSAWIFLLSRRRRSVLLRPEALRLERANPAHLVGTRGDVARKVPLLTPSHRSGLGFTRGTPEGRC